MLLLTLRERDALRRTAVHHVLDVHGGCRNAYHFVATVHDFAFPRNEDVIAVLKKYLPWLPRRICETVKLQWNGRRWRRSRRTRIRGLRVSYCGRHGRRDRYFFSLRYENVSAGALIFFFSLVAKRSNRRV